MGFPAALAVVLPDDDDLDLDDILVNGLLVNPSPLRIN
jgi:hypothetical protein